MSPLDSWIILCIIPYCILRYVYEDKIVKWEDKMKAKIKVWLRK